ncbi:MAG: DUF1161 domain-containing protein [Xenophilus sp.]
MNTRCPSLRILRLAVPLLFMAAGGARAQGTSCEALRADIEARIAATGVSRFSVTVMPADAPTDARVVGTCERGARKIVYAREPGPPPGTRPGGAQERILTECRDGTTSMGGSCKP